MNNRVFVYGTLRRSLEWHHILSNSNFLGEAKTKDKYALYADDIPYVIQNEAISNIIGEVYEVNESTLSRLDNLEGHPDWYCRKEINVTIEEKEISAWIYFFPKPSGKLIISGDYLDYQNNFVKGR